MKTRDLQHLIFGTNPESIQGPLSKVADRLIEEHEEREAKRFVEAEAREIMGGSLAIVDAVSREIKAAQENATANSELGAATTLDAYSFVKSASDGNTGDRGLKTASYFLQKLWTDDPLGNISIGELSSLRDRIKDQFPKSAAKDVLSEIPDRVGFQSLSNLSHLTKIASEIQVQGSSEDEIQESYERVVTAYKLDGDDINSIRSRGYIRGLIEGGVSDRSFEEFSPISTQEALSRALSRYAQVDLENWDPAGVEDEEEHPQDIGGYGEERDPVEVDEDGEDSEFPHDEETEEMAEIESPTSGERLVVELGLADDQDNGFDVEVSEGDDHATTQALPHFETKAQLINRDIDHDSVDHEENEDQFFDMDTPEAEGEEHEESDEQLLLPDGEDLNDHEESEAKEVTTMIVDPSSGDELELTLSKVSRSNKIAKGMDPKVKTQNGSPAGSFASESMKVERDSKYSARCDGTHNLEAVDFSNQDERPVATKKAMRKVSKEEVRSICASMGLTTQTIESELLSGNDLVVGQYQLKIAANDDVELRRGEVKSSTLVRRASLMSLDHIVGDFMALSAAQFIKSAAPVKTPEDTSTSAYVITTEIPKTASKLSLNAKRIMAQVWKVIPDAEGEIMAGGRLQIFAKSASKREINRINRVLTDVFSIRHIEASKVSAGKTAQVGQGNSPMNPGATYADSTSPYIGKPPTEQQGAGQPMTPQVNPQQTAATGTASQQNFLANNADPMAAAGSMDMSAEEGMDLEADDMEMGMSAQDDMGMESEAHSLTAQLHEDGLPGEPIEDEDMDSEGLNENMSEDEESSPEFDPRDHLEASTPMPSDASQMSLNLAEGALKPEHQEAVNAAMQHFRDIGMLPLEAIGKFESEYKGLLEEYGDESSPQRAMAEAGIIKAMSVAFERPAVIPSAGRKASKKVVEDKSADFKKCGKCGKMCPPAKMKGMACTACSGKTAGTAKKADMPLPKKINVQQPDTVKVKKNKLLDMKDETFTSPSVEGPQRGSQAKQPGESWASEKINGTDGGDTNNIFTPPEVGGPQRGSQVKQRGTSFSNTDMFVGTDGNGEAPHTRMLEQVSKSEKMRSTKPGKKKSE